VHRLQGRLPRGQEPLLSLDRSPTLIAASC
jgi:hypothetical protein